MAQAVQLSIEYDPQPPYDAGSPEKAPQPIVDVVTAAFNAAVRKAEKRKVDGIVFDLRGPGTQYLSELRGHSVVDISPL